MSLNLDSLTQTGVLGIVLAWFMLRLEGILKDNNKALVNLELAIKELCLEKKT